MNRAFLIGNLTKGTELRTSTGGHSVCSFTVAVNRKFGEKNEVDYIPVVTWRALADNCHTYLSKGKKVAVSGRIQVRSYEAKDGGKRYVTEIIADEVEFLSPKSGGETRSEPDPNEGFEVVEPLGEDELPF